MMNREQRDAYNVEVCKFHKEFPNARMSFDIRDEPGMTIPIVSAQWENIGEGSYSEKADVMMRLRNIIGNWPW